MPLTPTQRWRVLRLMFGPWRKIYAQRTVRRTVQGVELQLPWSHMLPDFARIKPEYGQNLVRLAARLHEHAAVAGEPLRVIDIGANVGDTALQIIAGTDARVLCVEGDPYWADYLRRNVGGNDRVEIAEVFLTGEAGAWADASPVRDHGTTRFVQNADRQGALPAISTDELRAAHPDFDRVGLIKSDTDGLDAVLVPAAARAWKDSGPVLFFEWDPILTRAADNPDPNRIWAQLAELGYTRLAIWDNVGDPLGQLDVTAAAAQTATLEPRPTKLGYQFWDVAACRDEDTAARDIFDELVPLPFDVKGIWR